MNQFPVTIKELSRFTHAADVDQILAGIADGSVDIVIGTHRLLQQSVRFKDLGLVVVDEEQRFGVEHKEYLKSMRTAVDVLTMSATPIPRTLEMSLTGIREMTTILTPPEERHPILTFVGAYDPRQISAAIRRELLRDGQVFFIHNRVESINRTAAKLAELVPEARIAVAHGQMGQDALEKIMVGFWENDFDVLVSTTIVESGLDIPNANTLIVDRADTFGLSQLHQMRGRVGRARERGYAYFLYPPEKPLTELAHDRLATIAQHTELGAGMQVAHEGPGDPRSREPFGRRAVRPHRRGGLRPLRPAGRRGGLGVPRREAGAVQRGQGRPAGQRQPAGRTTCPGSGCGWRPTGRWRMPPRTRRSTRCALELLDRFGPMPLRGGQPAGGGPVQGGVPQVRHHRGVAAGPVGAVLAGAAARVGPGAAAADLRQDRLQVGRLDDGGGPSQGRGEAGRQLRAEAKFGGEPLRDSAAADLVRPGTRVRPRRIRRSEPMMQMARASDAYADPMRTTVRLDDDVATAAQRLSQARRMSMSQAVNELAREGMRVNKVRRPFTQETAQMGMEQIDISCVAEALEMIDNPDWK